MSHYRLILRPRGSLLLGGYTATQSASGSTAADARGLLIPASAIKGALRESAARLVRGAGGVVRGHQGSHAADETDEDVVGQLFGHFDIHPGKLRVGPLRPVGDRCDEPLAVRHHVTLERSTRQSAPQRLFDLEVTPAAHDLRFEGRVDVLAELDDEEQRLFKSAVRLTDQVGGGRGHGLGVVRLELSAEDEPADGVDEQPEEAAPELKDGAIVLELLAEEPLQLGGGRDASNLEKTDDHLAGSVARGAVAAVLARIVPAAEREDVLEQVMGGERPVVFGVARVGEGAIPAPTTLYEPKGKKTDGQVVDRAFDLVLEALGHGGAPPPPDTRTAKGTWTPGESGWQKVKIPRRLVTRSARNPIDGRASEGQLFSIEALDPDHEERTVLAFHLPVEGESEQLSHVVSAARDGLTVGGTRGRGFGRLRLVGVRAEEREPLESRHGAWVEALVARGADLSEAESTGCLLALGFVAVSPRRLNKILGDLGLELLGGETRRHHLGGWNTRVNLPRSAAGGFAMGSVFLVRTRDGTSALEALAVIERHGLGPGRADGWGRVVACHRVHSEIHRSVTSKTGSAKSNAEGDERRTA